MSNQKLVDAMVDRFLRWKLPDDFAPDCGISFTPPFSAVAHVWPVGTNLFTAAQARAMIVHMLGDVGDLARAERERVAQFIESRQHEADGDGRGTKELADAVRGMPDA